MHTDINKGLERGIGPGLTVSTSMGDQTANDSRVAGVQEARQRDNGRVDDSLLGWRERKGAEQTKGGKKRESGLKQSQPGNKG